MSNALLNILALACERGRLAQLQKSPSFNSILREGARDALSKQQAKQAKRLLGFV
jgi:hypothetical protein